VLNIDPEIYESSDIHIHVPEGAIPKDGPSAGITIATSLASALTGRLVRKDVGLSGEITLRGRVLPIGGVREKVLAAYRLQMSAVVLPDRNQKDLVELPPEAADAIEFHFASHMDQVLDFALMQPVSKKKKTKRAGSKTKTASDKSSGASAHA
ncbi:MAG: S16 family serine protease, partial [Anaerolineales bacterium]